MSRKPPSPQSGAVTARDAQLAEEYFRSASALDDGEDSKLEDAAAAYRRRWNSIRIWCRR